MCIEIIRNNSLVSGRTQTEAQTPTTEHIMRYCAWHPSVLTTRPHGQVEKVGHFKRKFLVERNVTCNQSINCSIKEWCRNFAADFFQQKLNFTDKTSKIAFSATLGELRRNLHGSSMARWKAHGRLPISANWTFFASSYGWGTMSK